MNKRLAIGCAIALTSLLAACGGSSGGSGPVVIPTTAPPGPTNYTAHISFTGGDASLTQGYVMNGTAGIKSAGPAQVIILQANPIDYNQSQAGWISGGASGQMSGTAAVTVSPQPSSSPGPASWTLSAAGVSFANNSTVTAAVAPTPNIYAVGVHQYGAGNASATVTVGGAPVSTTTNVIVYDTMAPTCTTVDPSSYGASSVLAEGGVQMVNGVATPTMDPTKADLYLSGPQCFGAFNDSSEYDVVVHCPYGCTEIANTAQFLATTSAAFVNPVTSINTIPQGSGLLNSGSVILVFKDAEGNLYKTYQTLSNTTNAAGNQAYCELGHCPDGT